MRHATAFIECFGHARFYYSTYFLHFIIAGGRLWTNTAQ